MRRVRFFEGWARRGIVASGLLLAGSVLGARDAYEAADRRIPRLRQERAIAPAASIPDSAAWVLSIIRKRRTVRRFRPTPVPHAHLMAILVAAHYAPTAGNQQPWRFLVVRDRGKLDRLKRHALDWYLERVRTTAAVRESDLESIRAQTEKLLEGVLSAPVYVAVLVDTHAPHQQYLTEDGTLAAGYLMIAARALGYGTGFFTTFFPEGPMKEFFGIQDRYSLICFTPIGVPDVWPQMPAKKPLEELVHFETFNGSMRR